MGEPTRITADKSVRFTCLSKESSYLRERRNVVCELMGLIVQLLLSTRARFRSPPPPASPKQNKHLPLFITRLIFVYFFLLGQDKKKIAKKHFVNLNPDFFSKFSFRVRGCLTWCMARRLGQNSRPALVYRIYNKFCKKNKRRSLYFPKTKPPLPTHPNDMIPEKLGLQCWRMQIGWLEFSFYN